MCLFFASIQIKETLIKAYDQDDEIQFPQSNFNHKNSIFKIGGVSNDN